jgi:hypothetical protein
MTTFIKFVDIILNLSFLTIMCQILTIKYSGPNISSRIIVFLETKQRPHSFCSSLVHPRLINGIGGFDMVITRLKKQITDKKKESIVPVML